MFHIWALIGSGLMDGGPFAPPDYLMSKKDPSWLGLNLMKRYVNINTSVDRIKCRRYLC